MADAGSRGDTARGFGFAVPACLLRGIQPVYMKALAHVPPSEVVAHRVVRSVPVAGAVLLKQRLAPAQVAAIALAAVAVGVLTWETGRVPVAALGLTLISGAYAYFKRSLPVGPNQGFLLEALLLAPFALAGLGILAARGEAHSGGAAGDTWLLAGAGIVTAVPLILCAHGAKGLRLSTIGILQFISPAIILLTAVFVFGEEFGQAERIAFPMIWAALAIYTLSLVRGARTALAAG